MKRYLITLAFIMACSFLFVGCDDGTGDNDGGACLQSMYDWSWCHDFNEESDCTGLGSYDRWVEGSSCSEEGYSYRCSDGSYARSSGGCVN